MRVPPISSVAIAGGGIVGWSAAAALKKRIPQLEVTVVRVEPPADALADRIVPTLPSIVDFHEDIRLTEADTVGRANSGYRLGTSFSGWADGLPDYVHAYGEYGSSLGAAPFHQHWLRASKHGTAAAFDEHSMVAVTGRSGKFLHPGAARLAASHAPTGRFIGDAAPDASLIGGSYGYGLHIDPVMYRTMMRAYSLHLGATERQGNVAGVRLRGDDGFVEALQLDDGSEVGGDLFIDATGPRALVRAQLDDAWEDWSGWLPCDRILFAETAAAEPAVLDKVQALTAGWRWQAFAPGRTSHGLVYCSRHLGDTEAERMLSEAGGSRPTDGPVPLRQGCRPRPWLRNCVAIGDSAIAVEPLEWTNLHLAHNAVDRIVAMMPDRDCSPVELWDYNRQVEAEVTRARDFLVMHYATARRAEPFWAEVSTAALPPSLEHTLLQFRERGRLPFYEEETFARDSWLAVLIGQGIIPRRIDPLVETVPKEEAERAIMQMRESIAAAVARLPRPSDYLRGLSQQARQ